MRPRRWTRPAARAVILLLAVAAAAACADFLAAPAKGTAGISLSLQPAPPAGQTSPGQTFDQVDGLSVRVARGQAVVMADSFAVAPSDNFIRQVIIVPLDADEEDVQLSVELHADGRTVFAGGQLLRLVRGEQTTAHVELLPVGAAGRGALYVDVENALTGARFAGATVTVRGGANALPGDPVVGSAVTGTEGLAVFPSLAAGPYTLFVAAPGMIGATVPGVGVRADSVARRAVVLSPVVPAGQTRVVLTWAPEPGDLDAHLLGPDGDGGTFHVFYADPFSPDSAAPDVELDVDETEGFGPETVTIHQQFTGTYCFSVHNFSGEVPLSASGAQVRVFRGGEQVAAFSVPSRMEDVWNVFRMNGTTITALSTTSGDVPETCP